MLQSKLLATSSLLIGVLGSGVCAQPATTVEGTVKLLFLGKEVPTATVTGAVLAVMPTKTVYYINCGDRSESRDPCPIMGGTITQEATRWEYNVAKSTQGVKATEADGQHTYSEVKTTGTIICGVTSNRATCTGTLTTNATTSLESMTQTFANHTRSGTTTISTVIPDVTGNLEPVAITSGMSLLETSTTTISTTSSSTGAAAAFVTQPAGGLLLGVAGAAAVVGGALVL